MKTEAVYLYDIAECNLYNEEFNSRFKIPNIQRGLVWKSLQMELLWDSILRGFPIGSMLVLDKKGFGEGDLLDGQQRANAIIAGFNKTNILGEKKPKNIIWLDLTYTKSESDKERRKFGIRTTNSSHPWGYDGYGNKLSASDRRESLRKAYGDNYSRKKSDWDIRKFVPHYFSKQKDFLPIPLAILVSAAKGKTISNMQEFKNTVVGDVKKFSEKSPTWKNLYEDKVLKFIENEANKEFFSTFLELNNYRIIFNFVDNNDDIEILFNRVNSRGTQMTNAELAYAAIKHYGAKLCRCQNIGQVIKEKSVGIMLEQNLAQLLFRYCFSDNNISGEINASRIREKALLTGAEAKTDRVVNNLTKMFAGENKTIDTIIKRTKEILLKSPDDYELPNFLMAEIASAKPNLFVLLFCIIEKQNNLKDPFVQALIFYLYCFSINNEPVRLIFEKVSGDEKIDEDAIINILRDSISREWCYPIISSFKNFPALNEVAFTSSWNIDRFSDVDGFSVFRLLFSYGNYQGYFMLKYAQRRFYKELFGDYDPSNKEQWDEINRPWDHDHIIPKRWIPEDGEWKNCISQWVNSMGNIADIPYEENRGKSDDANWDYYDSNDKQLYYNDSFKNISPQSFEKGNEIINFMSIVKERFISISDDFLKMFTVLQLEDKLSSMQLERKRFFDLIHAEYFSDYDMYYRNNSGQEVKFDNDNILAWQRPWLSLIKRGEEKFAPAISIYALPESKTFIMERGNRNKIMTSSSDSWWEEGTWFRRQMPLFEKEKKNISFIAKVFCYGDRYYSKKASGFVLNSTSLLAYKTRVKGVDVNAKIYESYGCFHCSIESNDNKTPLPDCVINANFNTEKYWNWNKSKNKTWVDCYLSGKNYDLEKVCDAYANLMIELSRLNNR